MRDGVRVLMKTVICTGAAVLFGLGCVKQFAQDRLEVVGIGNELCKWFWGEKTSILLIPQWLIWAVPGYDHRGLYIGSKKQAESLCRRFGYRYAPGLLTNPLSSCDNVACLGALTPTGRGWKVQFVEAGRRVPRQ